MMLQGHKDYQEYVNAQIARSKRRTNHGRRFVQWADEVMLTEANGTIHAFVPEIKTMVCHGCRIGFEVQVFENLNPGAYVYGTDLYGRAYKYNRDFFREMDFDTVPDEWKGYFDVVYSNSLDHSRNPIVTLNAWKDELKDNGIIYCVFQWGSEVNMADCFCLSKDCIEGERYKGEIEEIAKGAGLKTAYFSVPSTVPKGHPYYVDTVLRRV